MGRWSSLGTAGCLRRRAAAVTTAVTAASAAVLVGGMITAGAAAASAGPAWSALPTPYPMGPVAVQLAAVSCASPASCMAVGTGFNSNGVQATLAEHWNGSTWKIEQTPNPAGAGESLLLGVSCTSPAACTAAGYYQAAGQDNQLTLAEAWNGSTWKIEPSPSPAGASQARLLAVSCTSPASCSAVGLQEQGSNQLPLAETWNGTAWAIHAAPQAAGSADGQLSGVSCTAKAACTAVGSQVAGKDQTTLADVWNGSAWAVQKTPNATEPGAQGSILTSVSCIAGSTQCTAAGYSISAEGDNVTLAEARSGTTWKVQKTPTPAGQDGIVEGTLNGLSCASGTACTAVGDHIDTAGNDVPLAEAWNGTAWTIKATPVPTLFAALAGVSCPAAAACTAVGQSTPTGLAAGNAAGNGLALVETWNGHAWTVHPTPDPAALLDNSLAAVSCAAADSCVAVGDYDLANGSPVLLSEIWNGAKWTIAPVPAPAGAEVPTMTAVSCVSAAYCVAVGFYTPAGSGQRLTLSDIWNGAKWALQPMQIPEGAAFSTLSGVSCTSPTACTAAGGDDVNGSSTLVETWNGKTWEIPSTPDVPGADNNALTAVSCASGTSCSAVGNFSLPGEPFMTMAESWNGTTWTLQSTPDAAGTTDNFLTGVSCPSPGVCTASGYANTSSGTQTLAETLSGGTWTIIATPNPGNGSRLLAVSCSSATACSAVGDSAVTGTDPEVTLAEQWNGKSWVVQPTPNNSVGVAQDTSLAAVSCTSPAFCISAGLNQRFYVSQTTSIRSVTERYS